MASHVLYVRVPDELHLQLVTWADEHHSTLNSAAVHLLAGGLGVPCPICQQHTRKAGEP
jgi:hypothetical protein